MCRLLTKLDFPKMKFSLYFLGYHAEGDVLEIPADRVGHQSSRQTGFASKVLRCVGDFEQCFLLQVEWMFSQPATLELTHNWEHEPDFKGYHSGNSEPKGYGEHL